MTTEEIHEDKGKNQGLRHDTIRKLDLNTVLRLVSIATSSAKIKSVSWRPPESEDIITISGNIHLGLFGKYSSFKTTILSKVAEKYPDTIIEHSLTLASLVGSIDGHNNQPIPPLAWQARNRILAVDEFQSTPKEKRAIIDAFLSLCEEGRYEKTISRNSKKKFEEKDGDLYCLIEEDGRIHIKTRFSLIIASMKDITYFLKTDSQKSFMSRIIPIVFEVDTQTKLDILNGRKKIEIQEYPVQEHITLQTEDYKDILNFMTYHGYIDLQACNRLLNTLLRIRAVIGYFDEALFLQVADMFKNCEDIAEMMEEFREDHRKFLYGDLR
jgi:hypothetical protein